MIEVQKSVDGGKTYRSWRRMAVAQATLLEGSFPHIYRIVRGRLGDVPNLVAPIRGAESVFDKRVR